MYVLNSEKKKLVVAVLQCVKLHQPSLSTVEMSMGVDVSNWMSPFWLKTEFIENLFNNCT